MKQTCVNTVYLGYKIFIIIARYGGCFVTLCFLSQFPKFCFFSLVMFATFFFKYESTLKKYPRYSITIFSEHKHNRELPPMLSFAQVINVIWQNKTSKLHYSRSYLLVLFFVFILHDFDNVVLRTIFTFLGRKIMEVQSCICLNRYIPKSVTTCILHFLSYYNFQELPCFSTSVSHE